MVAAVSTRNLATYLDAVRGRDAIRRAIAEESPTPGRQHTLLEAEARGKLAYGKLTGGEIGRLRLILGGASRESGREAEPGRVEAAL